MANIMEQRRQAYQLPVPAEACVVVSKFGVQDDTRVADNRVVQQRGRVHNPKRVLESCVHRARVNLIGPGQLPDAPQPLERRLGDDLLFPVVQGDKPMNRAADFCRSGAGPWQRVIQTNKSA